MTELKPCPFCGGDAKSWMHSNGRTWLVECCHCGGSLSHAGFNDQEAIAAWNERAICCDVTAGMKKHRVRQITMIDENNFSVVMVGGSGEHKTYGSTVGEAINEGLAERNEWERSNK